MTNWENVVSGDELAKVARIRRRKYKEDVKVNRLEKEEYEKRGYVDLDKPYKDSRYIKMRKNKDAWELFEDEVWTLFFKMGFSEMNRDDNFEISYGKETGTTQQIDVFAYDKDTVVIVECKSSGRDSASYKMEIEALRGKKDGLTSSIRKHYSSKPKVKFIWAVSGVTLDEEDIGRLNDTGVELFDESAIEYYESLVEHLGNAAKYQLLGRLCEGEKISNMKFDVPAIRGKMGGHTYYSFSIEPEKLLKIGYVLHRNDANEDMMPTYQRMIKKNRLKQIREFINNGGYFPNSVIISIDGGKRGKLSFDIMHGGDDDISKLGVLHLPSKYRSAYIIDGQHRLYGYTDTNYAATNTIPVVAFEDLTKENQVELFMQINENQKSVDKNLRNTLTADLLYDSENYSERRKALRLRIGTQLGEDEDSPLYGRVVIGQNKRSSTRCVTLGSIEEGLRMGALLNSYNKQNQLVEGKTGLFDSADPSNDYAYKTLPHFLYACFDYFKKALPEEWELGEGGEGILTNNAGVGAFLRIFSDIAIYLHEEGVINPQHDDAETIVSKSEPYFNAIVVYYENIAPAERKEIRQHHGAGGPVKHWRYLQKAIHDKFPQFNPDGLEKWWADNSKLYNEETDEKLDHITNAVKECVSNFFIKKNGDKWLDGALSAAAVDKLAGEMGKRNSERERLGEPPLSKWDCADLETCKEITKNGSNWSDGLREILTEPELRGKQANKTIKTQWMDALIKIDKDLKQPGYSVSRQDYGFVCDTYDWVVGDTRDTDMGSDIAEHQF